MIFLYDFRAVSDMEILLFHFTDSRKIDLRFTL